MSGTELLKSPEQKRKEAEQTEEKPAGVLPESEFSLETEFDDEIRRESEESYDPVEHRRIQKPTSDAGALAHLLKTSLGSGILAMPMAIKNSGLALGVIGTILIGIICTHCLQMLIRSSQVTCKRARVPELGYAETADIACKIGSQSAKKYARPMKIAITVELLSSFILGNTVYVVFMSSTLQQVTDFYFNLGINVRYYMLAIWIPLIIMCSFRTLKSLVPFSVLANVFIVFSFIITLYYIFREIHSTSSVHYVAPVERFPFFLTTVVFSLEGIGTVMQIENEMKTPKSLLKKNKFCCGIIYVSMSVVVSLYTLIGFFGYLQYGEETEGSITLNLPITDILAQAVKILIALAIFFTYALQFYVPINITRDLILKLFKKKNEPTDNNYIYIDIGVRIGLVSLTIITAMVVPKLEPIITLVGAICFSMLGLTFPAILDLVVRNSEYGRLKWRLVKNALIIIFSLIVLLCGSYAAVVSIIDVYIEN